MPSSVDFYFWSASTYTYLTVNRIDAAAEREGIEVRWKPFNLRALLRENNHVPFPAGRAKTEYMWRDLERRALMHGLPFPGERPAYPSDPETLNFKAALIAYEDGWAREYALKAFEWWFLKGKPPGMDGNLAVMLREMGKDADAILSVSQPRRWTRSWLPVPTKPGLSASSGLRISSWAGKSSGATIG